MDTYYQSIWSIYSIDWTYVWLNDDIAHHALQQSEHYLSISEEVIEKTVYGMNGNVGKQTNNIDI